MIRIVCPHCHSPLSTAELEQVTIDGHLSLVCPECSSVLVSEPVECEQLDMREASCTVLTDAHA